MANICTLFLSVQVPTQEGVLPRAFRCICLPVRGGFKLNAALPENQFRTHSRVVPWDESFIQELRDGLSAFKICAGWPIFWMCMAEGAQLSISQAGQMATHRIPNDLIKSANPVAYVVIGLFVQNVLYPYLQQRQIKFGPVDRITSGFIIMSIAMVYAAIVRALIYRAAPCYRYPLACAASNSGNIPNQVHVLIQLPQFVIIALGEVFCWPTGSEYTYNHAPKSMKSILQACMLCGGIWVRVCTGHGPEPLDPGSTATASLGVGFRSYVPDSVCI